MVTLTGLGGRSNIHQHRTRGWHSREGFSKRCSLDVGFKTKNKINNLKQKKSKSLAALSQVGLFCGRLGGSPGVFCWTIGTWYIFFQRFLYNQGLVMPPLPQFLLLRSGRWKSWCFFQKRTVGKGPFSLMETVIGVAFLLEMILVFFFEGCVCVFFFLKCIIYII